MTLHKLLLSKLPWLHLQFFKTQIASFFWQNWTKLLKIK
jgi:hypothetical protein